MRIVSGKYRGRQLVMPAHQHRPTMERTREALFSKIQGRVEDSAVLDLFAGTGSLGLEALSRGAARVDFIDENKAAVQSIERTLGQLKAQSTGSLICQDVFHWLKKGPVSTYDLIFADPPYVSELQNGAGDVVSRLLTDVVLPTLLRPGGLFVLETLATQPTLPIPISWTLIDQRRYSTSQLNFLQRRPALPTPASSPDSADFSASIT
jgi:16S rRNA (guanine966-N2)-methyltransferase